ncbi:MAG: hypothetical protein HC900_13170, partial [Methylacidiphilales bacterium]|nr:hypothetical protein [Candidatus Methylacidiphilales bacterium]
DDRSFATFTPLYLKAGLPASAEPLFRAAMAAMHEMGAPAIRWPRHSCAGAWWSGC